MEWIRKRNGELPMQVNSRRGVTYLTFPLLEETGMVEHLFSTRLGGVSEGIYSSMNLSYTRGDLKEAVNENFKRIAGVFGKTPDHMVCSKQTHTTNVRRVTQKDCGKGVTRPLDYTDVDGLITNEEGVILATFFADCVPLYFVDVKQGAIGLSHSGWRGTVQRMGQRTLLAMKEAYGTQAEDVYAAIGPSICGDCYEVGEEVAEAFYKEFGAAAETMLRKGERKGKYALDLWKANETVLLEGGIKKEHLEITDLCTCCNRELLFSHRASNGKRGNLGAFMELRKS